MKKCPEYVRVEGKLYKIDTNFKTAIECNRIAEDPNIGDFERVLGIIYTLFGEEGLNNPEHYQRLLDYITPDYVHIMKNGTIIKSGDKKLVSLIEKHGYDEKIINSGTSIIKENV